MIGNGFALRWRMTAMGMADRHADHVVDGIQTHCETRRQTCRRQTRGQFSWTNLCELRTRE